MNDCYSTPQVFPQAAKKDTKKTNENFKPGTCQPNAWFLEIAFVRDVSVCVCVCPPPRLLITSGVIGCDMVPL